MVDFWGDHFNISIDKGPMLLLKTVDDRECHRRTPSAAFVIYCRPLAHSPAMLVYLEQPGKPEGHAE